MRMPKRGEKGFTLIELLIVVAILGVLAAVVIPQVAQFIGAGEEEAGKTERSSVELAVQQMMVDNGIATLTPVVGATGDMTIFPDTTATLASKGANQAFEDAAILAGDITAEVTGWLLYGCQVVTDVNGDGIYDVGDDEIRAINYTTTTPTKGTYTVDQYGTVTQVTTGYE